jgi:hypothetical protein
MMDFVLDKDSVQGVADHLEQTRINILAAIRFGMMEGMEGFAGVVASKLQGDPIGEGTGEFLASVESSPRVVETDFYIKGEVSTANGKYRNLGLWLQFGTHYPTTGKGLESYPKQLLTGTIAPANRASVQAHGHGAFRIAPKDFFNSPFQEYYPTILDTINQRIAEASDAD